jgi:hypothetical protein
MEHDDDKTADYQSLEHIRLPGDDALVYDGFPNYAETATA